MRSESNSARCGREVNGYRLQATGYRLQATARMFPPLRQRGRVREGAARTMIGQER